LRRTSLDFYAAVRSLYRQNRESEIFNGKVKKPPLPGEDE
jgi:ABC-type transporter lipoprotein component MlaA